MTAPYLLWWDAMKESRYLWKELKKSGIQFAYGDEKHIYRVGPSVEFTNVYATGSLFVFLGGRLLKLCPVEVPEGCSIFFVTLLKLS